MRSRDSSETEGQGPIYNPLYHHCRLETCFYIGVGQVITEIECSACGRVWRLCSKTIENEEGSSKIYFWQPDPELAIVKEQRKKAAIAKRQKMAAAAAAKRRAGRDRSSQTAV